MSSLEIFTFPVVVADSRHRPASESKGSRMGEFTYKGKTEKAKSQVDNTAPSTQTHQYFKVTKIQEAQKRIGLIERENKTLSARLADIYRGGSMVDCWNPYTQKSAIREKNNVELVRITMENQGLLKRLKSRKATYDRKQYELDWQNSRKFLKFSSRFLQAPCDKAA